MFSEQKFCLLPFDREAYVRTVFVTNYVVVFVATKNLLSLSWTAFFLPFIDNGLSRHVKDMASLAINVGAPLPKATALSLFSTGWDLPYEGA